MPVNRAGPPPDRARAGLRRLGLGLLLVAACGVSDRGLGAPLVGIEDGAAPPSADASRGADLLPEAGDAPRVPRPALDAPGGAAGDAPDAGADGAPPPRLAANGAACSTASACASGHCVDGVCCSDACAGPCRSCVAGPQRGRCAHVSAGAAPPRGGCPEQRTTCGNTGRCDGQGGCQRYPAAMCQGLGIVRASTPPAVDGLLDAAWAAAAPVEIAHLVAGAASDGADLGGRWRAAWTPEALFLFVEVADDALQNDSPQPLQDDAVEIFLDLDLSRGATYDGANDFQFVFGWRAPAPVELALRRTAGITFATAPQPGGWALEARLPWATLGVDMPVVGQALGIELHLDDDDPPDPKRDAKRAWFGTSDLAARAPSAFGTATLLGPSAP